MYTKTTLYISLFLFLCGTSISVDGYAIGFNSSSKISRTISNQVRKALLPELSINKGSVNKVIGGDFSKEGRMLLWTDNELSIWNLYTGKEESRVSKRSDLNRFSYSDSSKFILAVSDRNELFYYEFSDDENEFKKIYEQRNVIDVALLAKDKWLIKKPDGLSLYRFEDGLLTVTKKLTSDGEFDIYEGDSNEGLFSIGKDDYFKVYDLDLEVVVVEGDRSGEIRKENKELVEAKGRRRVTSFFKRVTGSSLSKKPNIKFIESANYTLGEKADLEIVNESIAGSLSVYMLDDAWLVIDEAGRYDAGGELLGKADWIADKYKFNVADFEEYYEPGLLSKYIYGGIPFEDKKAIASGVEFPPEVKVTIDAVDRGRAYLNVSLKGTGDFENYSVSIYHNGKYFSEHSDNVKKTEIELVYGSNSFVAVARKEGQPAIISDRIDINYGDYSGQPKLHVKGIGINQYSNTQLALNFAVADAEESVSRISDVVGGRFLSKKHIVLTDSEATKSKVVTNLRELKKVKKEDFVVLYLSGHGVMSGEEWYFLTNDSMSLSDDADIKRNGISSSDIVRALVNSPAKRMMLIIDACQSGAVLDQFSLFEQQKVLNKISVKTGVHILTATRSDQLAPEFESLGHGLFTYTLLNGLQIHDGHFNADRYPNDGVLSVRELQKYVQEYVPVLARYLTDSAGLRGEKGPDIWQPISNGYGEDFVLYNR